MSEKSYTNNLKEKFRKDGWTVINMESFGDGVPDFLIAKNKSVFVIEAKDKNTPIRVNQIAWRLKHKNNIYTFGLRKGHKSRIYISWFDEYSVERGEYTCPVETYQEVIDFFERRIEK